MGRDSSGRVVSLLLRHARALAVTQPSDHALLDGPPGIGCPVHATLAGADAALLVAEASRFGVHDVERVLGVAQSFTDRIGLVINKHDLWADGARELTRLAEVAGVEVVARLPFDWRVPELLAERRQLLELPGMREELERTAAWTRRALGEPRGVA